jgi:hypothetical protein
VPELALDAVASAHAPEAPDDAPSAILGIEGADLAADAAAAAVEQAPSAVAAQATPAADQAAPSANHPAVDTLQAGIAPDRALAISDRPTTPMLPDLPDMDRPPLAMADRLESLSKEIELLVEALDPIGATTSLPDEPLRDVIPEAPNVIVRAWLRSLLYLGRVVAPACREALHADDMLRARPLAVELAQAAPVVAGAVRASIVLAGFIVGPAGESVVPRSAPMLRRALASDRVARCLARLLNDLTALETWLGTAHLGVSARSWVSPASSVSPRWPDSQNMWPAPTVFSPSALAPRPVSRLPATTGLPPLPPLAAEPRQRPGSALTGPVPWRSSSPHLSRHATPRQQLPAPTARPPAPPPTMRSKTDPSDPANWSRYASGEWRIFGAVVAITLLFLLPGIFLLLRPNLSAPTQAASGATSTVGAATSASPTAVASPTATPTPKQPTPRPTSPAVVPEVSALTLVCGSPGVVLPLHNPSTTPQSWTLTLPSSVATDGLRGVVNPGKTYTIDLWARPGTQAGSATAYLVSAGQRAPIRLTLPGC